MLVVWTVLRISLLSHNSQIELIVQIFDHFHLFYIEYALAKHYLVDCVPYLQLVTIHALVQANLILNVVLLVKLIFSMQNHEGVLEKLRCRHSLLFFSLEETLHKADKLFAC